MKEDKKVFVLIDRYEKYWHHIKESELEDWKKDGSLHDGDLIVYPEKVLKVEEKTETKIELKLKETK